MSTRAQRVRVGVGVALAVLLGSASVLVLSEDPTPHDALRLPRAVTTSTAATTTTTQGTTTTSRVAATTTVPATTTTRPVRPTTTTRPLVTALGPATVATLPPPPATAATSPTTSAPAAICSSSASGANSLEADLFRRVNIERRARGLSALCWDSQRIGATRAHSSSMAQHNSMAHSSYVNSRSGGGGDARYDFWWENVGHVFTGAGGAQGTSGLMHVIFMQSSDHRKAIVASDLTVITIGVVCRPDGSFWVTEQFGRFTAQGPPPHGFTPPSAAASPLVSTDTSSTSC